MGKSFSVPVVSRIKVRWLEEMEQRQDVIMSNGQPTAATRTIPVSAELMIHLSLYTGMDFRGYTEGRWFNEPVPASPPYTARPAAQDLIGPDSVYSKLAQALYTLAGTELIPEGTEDAVAQQIYQDITSMEVYLPLHLPQERLVTIFVREYIDKEKKLPIGNRSHSWRSTTHRAMTRQTTGKAVEDLFEEPTIAPHIQAACMDCANVMQALYPTVLTFDKEQWLERLAETVAVLTGKKAE